MEKTIREYNELWKSCLASIKEQINDSPTFTVFFEPTQVVGIEGKRLVIAVGGSLAKDILTKQYLDVVNTTLLQVSQTNYTASFITEEELESSKPKVAPQSTFFKNSALNPDFTFTNYVVGSANREATQAGLFVASEPGKNYNPLFIYGDSGIGKSHLLHAIGNRIKSNDPKKKILIIDVETFIDEFTSVSTTKSSENFAAFKEYIFSFDVLLVDDIQFLANKTKTEEFFLSIFKSFHSKKKQMVFTCDRLPREINGLAERLVTRFDEGLPEKISKPDKSMCVDILKTLVLNSGLNLEDVEPDVLEFLSEKFSSSVRLLKGALTKLLAYTISFKGATHINLQVCMEAVGDLIPSKDASGEVTEKRIINAVASAYSLTPSQLTGISRKKEVAIARHVCMYLIKDMLDTPYKKIGALFGDKDHSTVISSVRKVETMCKTNEALRKLLKDIKSAVNRV